MTADGGRYTLDPVDNPVDGWVDSPTGDRQTGSPEATAVILRAESEKRGWLGLSGVSLPPREPRSVRYPIVTARVPAHLAAFIRRRAGERSSTINAYLNSLIVEDRDRGLPADCTVWLSKMAASAGTPGDINGALIAVLRHLADRWPDGARLSE